MESLHTFVLATSCFNVTCDVFQRSHRLSFWVVSGTAETWILDFQILARGACMYVQLQLYIHLAQHQDTPARQNGQHNGTLSLTYAPADVSEHEQLNMLTAVSDGGCPWPGANIGVHATDDAGAEGATTALVLLGQRRLGGIGEELLRTLGRLSGCSPGGIGEELLRTLGRSLGCSPGEIGEDSLRTLGRSSGC